LDWVDRPLVWEDRRRLVEGLEGFHRPAVCLVRRRLVEGARLRQAERHLGSSRRLALVGRVGASKADRLDLVGDRHRSRVTMTTTVYWRYGLGSGLLCSRP
jgi:hypothetical protein